MIELGSSSQAREALLHNDVSRVRLQSNRSAIDLLFLRRLWRIFVDVLVRWKSKELVLLVVFVALICGNEVLIFFVGMLPSALITGLINRDSASFFNVLWRAALYTSGEAILLSLIAWLQGLGGKKKEENVGFFIVYSKDRLLFSGV